MENKKKNGGLGRGIEALFADNAVDTSKETVVEVAVENIVPNPYQPRHKFDEQALKDLATSIKNSGVFQPIIVRQPKPGIESYQLLTGERRLRASRMAELATIPAIIRPATEEEMMEIAVLENLQREDLTPLEEAEAYDTLMTRLDLTQAQVANRLGKSRPYIANYLRILGLPTEVKDMLQDGEISMGQARTVLSVKDKRKMVELAKKAAKEKMTVRQLEQEANRLNGVKKTVDHTPVRKSPFVKASESQLQDKFGTQVAIKTNGRKKGQGKIEINYMSVDDLNRILALLDVDLD